MSVGQIKGHHVSIASSMLAAISITAFFFGTSAWAPVAEREMLSDFAVAWFLLTYLWVQMATHILSVPPTRRQMLGDMLSSMVPILVIVYVVAEYYKGDLQLSTFQINAAWLTAYAMLLDLVLDMALAISLHRQA